MNRSLGDALGSRDNALNFIRLCLASSVILSHTILLGGYGPGWYSFFATWGPWAVNGFFVLSGFLIAGSRMRTPLAPFLWRRTIRIMPAFWVNLVIIAFVFAPFSTVLTGQEYSLADGWTYVAANWDLKITNWTVGSTLDGAFNPEAWNGSVWSLWYEFGAYIVAALLLLLPVARRHGAAVFGLLTLLAIIGPELQSLRLASFFCAGMFLYFVRDRISMHWGVAAGSLAIVLVLASQGLGAAWGQLPYGFLLLWLGGRLPIRWGAVNDLSYGVYIYAFPMQQFLAITVADRLPFLVSCAIALALATGWATASWYWVEKPALKLKDMVPLNKQTAPARSLPQTR